MIFTSLRGELTNATFMSLRDELTNAIAIDEKDEQFEFNYIRKVVSEAEKNQQGGSNSRCHGVIPFLHLAAGFNPGAFFQS